jgi:integrase
MELYRPNNDPERFWYFTSTVNGRRTRKCTNTHDKRLAEKIAIAETDAILEGRFGKKPRSVASLLDDKLAGLGRPKRKRQAKKSPQNASLVARCRKAFGSWSTSTLTSEWLERWIEEQDSDGRAPASINRLLECLASAYRAAGFEPPKVAHFDESGNVRCGFLGKGQLDSLLPHLPLHLRDLTEWCYITGMRLGEAKSLRWSSVDDDTVRLEGKNAKTGRARSVVAVGSLGAVLERRRAARPIHTPSGLTLSDYIFHDGAGHRIGEFRRSWRTATKRAGLPNLVFHDLRRSALRNLIRAGVSQTVAMDISGHTTDTTFRRYNITDTRDVRDAFLKVDRHQEEEEKITAIR